MAFLERISYMWILCTLAGLGLLLLWAAVKLLVVPRFRRKTDQSLVRRLSTPALFVGTWLAAFGLTQVGFELIGVPAWMRAALWIIIGLYLVLFVVFTIRDSRKTILLGDDRDLTIDGPFRNRFYIIRIDPDFSRSPQGVTEDQVKVRPESCRLNDERIQEIFKSKYLSKPARPGTRNHIICIDGTWNDAETETNVHRLYKFLHEREDMQHQIVRYYPGVGIRKNEPETVKVLDEAVSRTAVACATGSGERIIRAKAYFDFVAAYQPGDRLFIFGFSRGAAVARMLANDISDYGIPRSVQAKYQRKDTQQDTLIDFAVRGPNEVHKVEIEVLGLWDTVAAFGLPWDKKELSKEKRLLIPANVREVYHLVAIHEIRRSFDITLLSENGVTKTEEIWFAGAHVNVGGGFSVEEPPGTTLAERGLSDITLRFMMERVKNRLRFGEGAFGELKPDPNGRIWDPGMLWVHGGKNVRRMCEGNNGGSRPRIHKSVFMRSGDKSENVAVLGENYTRDERD